jgi:hypothetical protein
MNPHSFYIQYLRPELLDIILIIGNKVNIDHIFTIARDSKFL